MWKLTIEDDEGKQTQLSLAYEEYGIGRGETNSIRLTDRNVSRSHSILKRNGVGWVVQDLQSYNGTFVNGARVVGEQAIAAGDIIQLGDYKLELSEDSSTSVSPPVGLPPVHQRPNRLVVVVGPKPGMEFPLDRDHFTMGRSEEATISINHSSVSRMHADLFALGNGRFEIVDKGSANGIRINGVELKRGILEAGDALELGDVRLRFVGAGKIFRADMSQQLTAVHGFETASGANRRGQSMGRLIGLGALVGVLILVGGVLLLNRGPRTPTNTAPVQHLVTEKNAKLMDEAVKLLSQNAVEDAHKKLLEIPEDVRPTDAPNWKRIENAWADLKFQQVESASDSKAKKNILREIASTETVDPRQRTKAAELIHQIEASEPPPPVYGGPTLGTSPNAFGGSAGSAPTTQSSAAKSADTQAPSPASGPPNEEQLRKQLEPRVWSGKASPEEIRMLKAICGHMGDQTCRSRAAELLKKKQD